MTRATKMANAGANMFKAVPLITWFAFILMEAYPWNREKNMPVAMEIKTARISCIWPLMVPTVKWINRIPVNAPMVMIPSSAILIIPLRSENMAPRATIIRGIMKYMVC